MINFSENLKTDSTSVIAIRKNKKSEASPVNGIEIRLSDIKIFNNKTTAVFPFPGLARVYLICIVVSDIVNQPISFELNGFEKINDGDNLNIDRAVFFWKKSKTYSRPPNQIHVFTSLIKSKESTREIGGILRSVKKDKGYSELLNELKSILQSASQINTISNVAFKLAGIVANYLGKVEDKPLLSWMQSFTDLSGDFDKDTKKQKTAKNKFASMKLRVIVQYKKMKSIMPEKSDGR